MDLYPNAMTVIYSERLTGFAFLFPYWVIAVLHFSATDDCFASIKLCLRREVYWGWCRFWPVGFPGSTRSL
ncbi:hypothetical protein BDV59DRAFT_177227 [Aspergillus ambiguus]|uniref:uncharacterized protein n=1 Tax=Aspergillus ambiguus TaxID=176160 RepID=UPI003CCE1C43